MGISPSDDPLAYRATCFRSLFFSSIHPLIHPFISAFPFPTIHMRSNSSILWSKDQRKNAKKYFWRYEPLGKRVYIDASSQQIATVDNEVDKQRIMDIEDKTLLSFAEFRSAHCSGCPVGGTNSTGTCSGGYFLSIAPEVCSECANVEIA
uniref:Uncharacterized protein n=1 Tax=Craspedostauros australis TaxID=1486917 RepID=A0A7R9WV48_9STRA|mmetsp:Transcript_20939/g.58231  ORF Transcript_20939/g.58231 Transcript_20939/m.58231 type:complete len:150 (+) Transcript_20939:865-1314(+)